MTKLINVFLYVMGASILITFMYYFFTSEPIENQHMNEIKRVIEAKGGNLISITKMNQFEKNPFNDEVRYSYNIVYKIKYSIDNKELEAWYRGVKTLNNIHDQKPYRGIGGYGEKWLFISK